MLSRPCPQCGLEAGAVAGADIGAMTRANAAAWQQVLQRPDVRERPAPGVWSPLEYACHVRDVYLLFDSRLAQMLAEDDPLGELGPGRDRGAERYAEQDAATVAGELADAAAVVAARFDSVREPQWDRTARRSDGASFTTLTFGPLLRARLGPPPARRRADQP